MKRTLVLSALICAIAPTAALAGGEPAPVLTGAAPSALDAVFSGASNAQKVTIFGKGFESAGHPDYDQYDHWQVRIVRGASAGAWVLCQRVSEQCADISRSSTEATLRLGGTWFYRASKATLEFRYWHGLAAVDAPDPSQAAPGAYSSPYSNVLRVPILEKTAVASPKVAVVTPPPTPSPTPRAFAVGVTPRVDTPDSTLAGSTLATVTCPAPLYVDRIGTHLLSAGKPLALHEGQTVFAYAGTFAGPGGPLRALDLGTRVYVTAACIK